MRRKSDCDARGRGVFQENESCRLSIIANSIDQVYFSNILVLGSFVKQMGTHAKTMMLQ